MRFSRLPPVVSCLLIIVITVVTSISSANASLITFQFQGEVSSVDAPLVGPIQAGQTILGTYTFDSTVPTTSPPPVSVYENAISSMTLVSGGYTVTASNGNIIYDVETDPLYQANFSPLSGSSINEYSPILMRIFWDASEIRFQQETPPTEPLFNSNGGFLLLFENQDQSSSAFVRGTLTSVTVVPVPGTVWLLGSGLMSVIALNQRK